MSELSNIFIGTCGWSYPRGDGTWKGHFYPAGKINELEYYSQFFDTVEINSSFYRPPDPGYAERWVKQTPPGFIFTAKLWQKFTHPGMYRAATGEVAAVSPDDVSYFHRSIEPLAESGKLGALLAQFPPSLKHDESGWRLLAAVIRTFGRYRLAVELRHRSWSDAADTGALLRENNVAWVQIDEPQFSSSIAAGVPLTADMAYFRFHGRNREAWWRGNSETRYKYLYSDREIGELADRVKQAAGKTRRLFAFFNNHWQGYAPRNAVRMKQALKLPYFELPVPVVPDEDTEA